MSFDCVSRTDVGLKRKINEDAMMVRTERGLWAVADGMGGHDAGEVASGKIAEALASLPIVYSLQETVDNALAALRRVNYELIALARGGGQPRTIGSTVVGLAISGDEFRCFWAGDSRAYRIRAGRITQLSRDHSLVHDLVLAVLPGMAERRAGGILISGSVAGNSPIPNNATYAASKAFVNTFSESLRSEVKPLGIHVTVLAPGPVRTELPDPDEQSLVEKLIPDFLWISTEHTAKLSLDGLARNKMRVVPGVTSKAMSAATGYAPRAIVTPIVGAVYKKLAGD